MMPDNPIVGGTALRIPAIQSPNFVTTVSGWIIRQDGTAEFTSVTIRGTINAATIIGALIESSSSGRRTTIDSNGDIKVYNNSGAAILFWFSNGQNALWQYADTGSSTQGALVASTAAAGGTDPFGNAYVAGFATYSSSTQYAQLTSNALNFADTVNDSVAPASFVLATEFVTNDSMTITGPKATGQQSPQVLLLRTSASWNTPSVLLFNTTLDLNSNLSVVPTQPLVGFRMWADTSGFPRYRSSASGDGTAYEIGEAVYYNTAAQTISSTTPVVAGGLTQQVDAGAYYIKGLIRLKQGATNVVQLVGLSGPSASNAVWYQWTSAQAGSNTVTFVQGQPLSTVSVAFAAANDEIYWRFEGTIVFSASGQLSVVAAEGTAGDTFTVQPGCFFIVRPIQ